MTVTRAIARPMLAGIFLYGGIDALLRPEDKAARAEDVAPALADRMGIPTRDPLDLIRLNGAVQVAGATLLAVGKTPRLASAALAASLAPTTYAGHRFWEETDENARAMQRMQFLKNVSILGGLILAATDTEGRPSLSWRARRGLKKATKASKRASKRATKMTSGAAGLATVNLTRQALKATEQLVKATEHAARDAARGAASSRPVQAAAAAPDALRETVPPLARAARQSVAELAREAAREAAKDAKVARSVAGPATRSMAKSATGAARDTSERAREAAVRARDALQDGSLDRARHMAADLASDAASRVKDLKESLPLAG